jgi:CRISPR-associated protein Csx16
MAGPGGARFGKVWQAGLGLVWQGTVRLGKAGSEVDMYFLVTRHPGAKEWLMENFKIPEGDQEMVRVVDHFDPMLVDPDDVVVGTLPINLVAQVCEMGGEYHHLTVEIPRNWRGRELTVDDIRRFGVRLERYVAARVTYGSE